MKIIYSLSGQGFGHSTRSKETIRHLINKGHEVKVMIYGQAFLLLGQEFETWEIPGLTLTYKYNNLSYFRTISKNIINTKKLLSEFLKIYRKIKEFNPDLIITDFEPLSALIAKLLKKPLISIDNQHQLTHTKIDIPFKYRKNLFITKIIINLMVWGANKYLITSFFRTIVKNNKAEILPPVLRKEILDLKPYYGDYLLIYEGAELSKILPILKESGIKCIIFGPHREGQEGNLIFKNFNIEEWLKYLEGAKAVIATGGASLISECVYLKKPYLVLPIKKQIEQIINAIYLKKLGYGECSFGLTKGIFNNFIDNLPHYIEALSLVSKSGNDEVFSRLDEIIKEISKS